MRTLRRLLVALALLAVWASPASAAYAFVNSVSAGAAAGGGNFTTGSVNMAGANLIVCGSVSYNGAAIATVSDSNLNTYSYRTTFNGAGGNSFLRIAYVQGAGVGTAGMTFTSTSSGTAFGALACVGFSGSTSTPFDTDNGASLTILASTGQPGSITPAASGDVIVTVIDDEFGIGAATINSSFVSPPQETVSWHANGSNLGIALTYKIKTDALAENPTWSWANGTSNIDITQAAFLAGTGGGGGGGGSTAHTLGLLGAGK
jgi:hypothetical protein